VDVSGFSFDEDQAYFEVATQMTHTFGAGRFAVALLFVALALIPAGLVAVVMARATAGHVHHHSDWIYVVAVILIGAFAMGRALGQWLIARWVALRLDRWIAKAITRRGLDEFSTLNIRPTLMSLYARLAAGADPDDDTL